MHEMDAIRCREWRIFPLTFFLEEKVGHIVFVLAHIPLYVFLLQGLMGKQQAQFIIGLDYFCMIHLFLHILYLKYPKNEFKDWISWTIIAGAGLFGALDTWL
jgi:hypothetical protein